MMMIFEWCWIVMDFTTKTLQRVPKTAKVETSGGCFLPNLWITKSYFTYRIRDVSKQEPRFSKLGIL